MINKNSVFIPPMETRFNDMNEIAEHATANNKNFFSFGGDVFFIDRSKDQDKVELTPTNIRVKELK